MIEGAPFGSGRSGQIVVVRYNSEISNGLLESALRLSPPPAIRADHRRARPRCVEFRLVRWPRKMTRRYSCVIGLGCVIRGETAHFDFVATEAASGLQLAGLETGVPVSFGVLTVDTVEQAQARIGKGGDAAWQRSRWPTSSPVCAQCEQLGSWTRLVSATLARDVQGLRHLRQETRLRQPPEPLDGRYQAALRAEPPARPRPPRRQGAAGVRLHALPQGRQGSEGALEVSWSAAACAIGRTRTPREAPSTSSRDSKPSRS